MFSPASGVDVKIIPTAGDLAQTKSVSVGAVPAHNGRSLSTDEKQLARSKVRAAYLLVNGSTQLHEKLLDMPVRNRELMHQFDDLYVLAFLVASFFYSPATLNYVIENICQRSNNNSWDMQHVGRILALLWRAKFSLRIDDTTIYFLPRDATSGMDSFSIPIRTLSSLKGYVPIYCVGELVYRHHLWHRQSVSQDSTKMCMEQFAYDAELREMIIRSAVCASIIIFAMQKGGPAKAQDIRLALDTVRNDWSMHPEEFLVPLSAKDVADLDEIIQLMHLKTFQATELNKFANHLDVITAGIDIRESHSTVAPLPRPAAEPEEEEGFFDLDDDDDGPRCDIDEEDFFELDD